MNQTMDLSKKRLHRQVQSHQALAHIIGKTTEPCISSISQEIAYHQHEVLYIIIAKVIQPTADDMRLRR